jgi:hypothetical protein
MQRIKQFIKIIDFHTLLVTGLLLLVVYLCRQFNFLVELPTTLIGIAVVFPLVFSMNSAYKRWEDALRAFASLKAPGCGGRIASVGAWGHPWLSELPACFACCEPLAPAKGQPG